jgi:HAMP domain-containing protein
VLAAPFRAARMSLTGVVALLLALLGGVLVAVHRYLARRISGPATELAVAAEAVAAGDFSVEIGRTGSDDEIGRLGRAVGAMILVPLEEISNNWLGGKGAGLTFVVYGAIIVLIARFQPGGILTLIKRIWSISDKAAKAFRRTGWILDGLTRKVRSVRNATRIDRGPRRRPAARKSSRRAPVRGRPANRGRAVPALTLPNADQPAGFALRLSVTPLRDHAPRSVELLLRLTLQALGPPRRLIDPFARTRPRVDLPRTFDHVALRCAFAGRR